MEHRQISLNILLTYPVHWGRYQILRDFVQNFYDGVGYQSFHEHFHYDYQENRLRMWTDHTSFSYEWLLHIGASTKGGADDQAGYFGEGFKIAALCAYRDQEWDITMESADWSLHVISIQHEIDNKPFSMLAYDVENRDYSDRSCLTISNLQERDYRLFKEVIHSFYYPENPLFGQLIWAGDCGAVYTRSAMKIPDSFPVNYHFGRKGAVFCAYQMLGTNPFDLVVCYHPYQRDDRERKALYEFDVIDILGKVAAHIDSEGAAKMLIRMKRYWYTYKKKRIDLKSWSPVVDTLIYRLGLSNDATYEFINQFPNLICAAKVHTVTEQNRRIQARSWLSKQQNRYILVKDSFERLGYPTLEETCEKNGGFVTDGLPQTEAQREGFVILQDVTSEVFSELFRFPSGMPEGRIIVNEKAIYHGMAVCHKLSIPVPCFYAAIKVKSRISAIYLKQSIFRADGFYDALATYVHEACHMFGGDGTKAFSLALTFAIEILLKNREQLARAQSRWDSLFAVNQQE